MRKTDFCIYENKGAVPLLSFIDRTISVLPKSEISSFWPSSVVLQLYLSDQVGNPKDRFSHNTAHKQLSSNDLGFVSSKDLEHTV